VSAWLGPYIPWCYTDGPCDLVDGRDGADIGYCTNTKNWTNTPPCLQDSTFASWTNPAGCTCLLKWWWPNSTHAICNGGCANPDNDPRGPRCYTDGPCDGYTEEGDQFGYCTPPKPPPIQLSCVETNKYSSWISAVGCRCMKKWSRPQESFSICNRECAFFGHTDGVSETVTGDVRCYTEGPCDGVVDGGQYFGYCTFSVWKENTVFIVVLSMIVGIHVLFLAFFISCSCWISRRASQNSMPPDVLCANEVMFKWRHDHINVFNVRHQDLAP
jgi:hypothetical protein